MNNFIYETTGCTSEEELRREAEQIRKEIEDDQDFPIEESEERCQESYNKIVQRLKDMGEWRE